MSVWQGQRPRALLNSPNVQWHTSADAHPSASGVYLTRNNRDQIWFKYFDAYSDEWCMSWGEMKENSACQTAKIHSVDLPLYVTSWAKH